MLLSKKSNLLRQNYCGVTTKYYMKFSEWLHEAEWGGASFDGTWTNPYVNDPSYWYNSKYQGKGALWNAPSNMKAVNKKYGVKAKKKDLGPIEDRVPDEGKDERDKEENWAINAANDPMVPTAGLTTAEKLYKLTPTYKLKR